MKKYLLIFIFFIGLTGCQNQPVLREFDETVLEPRSKQPLGAKLPSDHPEIPDSLPEGHPDISQEMGLPPGHPDITGTSMGMGDVSPEMQQMLQASMADVPLAWQLPQGWQEIPGQGMRLVSFKVKDFANMDCSIVSLGGMAGGLEANINRWAGQIGLAALSPENVQNFIKSQSQTRSETGAPVQILNFTDLQKDSPDSAASMVAAIINLSDTTIFVKMLGTKGEVLLNLEKFRSLCQSIQLKK